MDIEAVKKLAGRFDEFKKNIKNAGVDGIVTPIVKTSEDAAKDFNERVEFVFIDGAHEYDLVKLDFDLWFPKLVDGGIMALHDTTNYPGPRKVAAGIFKSRHFRNAKIHAIDKKSLRVWVQNSATAATETGGEETASRMM